MSEAVQSPAQDTPKADQGAVAPNTTDVKDTAKAAVTEPPKGEAAQAKADPAAADKGKPQEAAAEKPGEKPGEKTSNDKTDKPEGEKLVPEKYELKLPEGSLLKPEALEKAAQIAKELKLSNGEAQGLLNRENEAVASYVKDFDQMVKEKADGFIAEGKADKEIGGDKFQENVEQANRVINRFGSEAFKKQLNETRLGNHPELVRIFARIGKVMDDDKLILAGTGNVKAGKSAAEILYGNSSKK